MRPKVKNEKLFGQMQPHTVIIVGSIVVLLGRDSRVIFLPGLAEKAKTHLIFIVQGITVRIPDTRLWQAALLVRWYQNFKSDPAVLLVEQTSGRSQRRDEVPCHHVLPDRRHLDVPRSTGRAHMHLPRHGTAGALVARHGLVGSKMDRP